MLNPLNFISKFIKSSNQKELDRVAKIVEKVNSFEDKIKDIPDDDFPKKTIELKKRLSDGEDINSLLPEAFALVREASKRTRNEKHYDVQIIGGIVLHEGKIAEMRTGEGKTLTISLAAYLNALRGKGVHIVTVNDYLAKRDSQEMGEIYQFLGLTSGYINNDQDDHERKKNYNFETEFPQRSAVCTKILTISPKKPNSANRRVCKVRLIKSKQNLTVKIPGEGHTLQQHSTVLIRCGRSRDLIGVRNIAIRGKYDLNAVANRSTSRSIYGVKKTK